MILIDTSVWIDHFRLADAVLQTLLHRKQVILHDFVIGELALGNRHKREVFLMDLSDLPQATIAEVAEVLDLIEQHKLHGRGIGYVDAHLLATARITPGLLLWTHDQRLHQAAVDLSVAFTPAANHIN